MQSSTVTAVSLEPYLKKCGYTPLLLANPYEFSSGQVPLAAFADTPHDARSICIAAIDAPEDPQNAVASIRSLGSPVVFACHAGKVQWWKQTTGTPLHTETIKKDEIQNFFDQHKKDFNPGTIFEGKTLRRLPGRSQLSFVDAGLMPFVERKDGDRLSHLVVLAFRDIENKLKRPIQNEVDIQNAIKATFWLLAAKALRDKNVDGFKTVDLLDIDDVFSRVGRHYGVPDDVPPPGKAWHEATSKAAERIGNFENLRNLSTEALAHVYENALVTPEVRKALGTHSTPGSLVDYIVWQLWPWIEALPSERRHIFEPACGHGAFLVSALRVLRQWSGISDSNKRHDYLKKHLHGVEIDGFALEVARLSLTLADIPHGNTWNLKQADMFAGTILKDYAKKCGVLLANPPYEKFTQKMRAEYSKAGVTLFANTKASEMLYRTIPHLPEDACFGVVIPQGLLHSKEGTELRRSILSNFELKEIDLFGDQLFEKSDHEVAVLMGRRNKAKWLPGKFWFRRVKNTDIESFRDRFMFSSEEQLGVLRFLNQEFFDLRLPELDVVWQYLSTYPKLTDIAKLGQGLFHKGKDLPSRSWTIHEPAKMGDVLGFANIHEDLAIYDLPKEVGINISTPVIDRAVAGLPTNTPQVIVNYARVSRATWLLKAILDETGHAITSRFIAIRSTNAKVSPLYLWAILNSPIANAFAFCHSGKRDILVGTIRKMPVPIWSSTNATQIEQAAMRYRILATSPGHLFDEAATPEGIKHALLKMDAAVLRAYDLPPRLERQLLDFFCGVERKGVGCIFTGYYPAGFTSFLPLHVILSEHFRQAAANLTVERFKPGQSTHVKNILNVDEE